MLRHHIKASSFNSLHGDLTAIILVTETNIPERQHNPNPRDQFLSAPQNHKHGIHSTYIEHFGQHPHHILNALNPKTLIE